MMFVHLDESWTSKTEISGYDQQICPGTFPFLRRPPGISAEGHPRISRPERTRSRRPRSRRLRKTETRSGTQPDGSSYARLELLHPHLLPGENGAHTRHASVRIGSQLIGTAQTKRVRLLHGSHISYGIEVIFIDPHKVIHDKITSVCDGVHLFAISATCPVCCETRVRLSKLLFMQQTGPCLRTAFFSSCFCLAQGQPCSLHTV